VGTQMINWKLIAIILISVILIIIGYSQWPVNHIIKESTIDYNMFINETMSKKINNFVISEEELKKIKVPENMMIYYFPGDCPHYTQDMFIHIVSNGLDKYFVPETKSLILVKKDHKWTNEPKDFVFWSVEAIEA